MAGNGMVERVADAIARALNVPKVSAEVARAVIEAMREPTEAMLRAGVRGFQKAYSSEDSLADWRACWMSMIHEALR